MLKKAQVEEYKRIIMLHPNITYVIYDKVRKEKLHEFKCTIVDVLKGSSSKEKFNFIKKDYDNNGKLRSPHLIIVQFEDSRLLVNVDTLKLQVKLYGLAFTSDTCKYEYRLVYND